jgi:hypothetical protein
MSACVSVGSVLYTVKLQLHAAFKTVSSADYTMLSKSNFSTVTAVTTLLYIVSKIYLD